jgi:hypothetical protein
MMNATTEATKLNFMTDQGSTRASVSIACRLAGLRTWVPRVFDGWPFAPRRCQAEATEFAKPAAAPLTPAAAPLTAPVKAEAVPEDDPLPVERPSADFDGGAIVERAPAALSGGG